MPKTKEQIEVIRTQKSALIKNAAIELFANEGYHATSISKIAKTAHISKGLIYNYFDSKEALIKEIIWDGFDSIMSVFDTPTDEVLTKEKFIKYVDDTFYQLQNEVHFWKLYFSIIIQPAVMLLVQDKLMEVLMPFINTLVKYYECKGVENPMAHARFLGAVLDGVSMNYIADSETFPLDDIKKILIDKFI